MKRSEIFNEEKAADKYHAILDSFDDAFVFCELLRDEKGKAIDFRYLEFNRAFERRRHSGFDPRWLETYEKVVESGEAVRMERLVDGHWYDVGVYPFDDDCFSVIFRDISERKEAEERKRKAARLDSFRVMLMDALRLLSRPFEIQAIVMRAFGEHLQVSRAFYCTIDSGQDSGYFVIDQDYCAPGIRGIAGRYPAGAFGALLYNAANSDRTLAVSDVATHPGHSGQEITALTSMDIRSYIAVPLVNEGRLVGMLGIHHQTPRDWTSEEIALAEEVADRTWFALEVAKGEDSLRKSEALLAGVFEASPIGLGFTDMNGNLLFGNKAIQRFTPTGKMSSKDDRWVAYHPDGSRVPPEEYPAARALRGISVAPGMDMQYIADDGSRIWTRVAAIPLRSDDDEIIGTVSVIVDISELKETDESLRKSEERLTLALTAAGMGTFEWTSFDRRFIFSETSRQVFGLKPGQPASDGDEGFQIVHPGDRPEYQRLFERAAACGEDYHIVYRIIRPIDGKMAWIEERGKGYWNPNTGISRIIGIRWDVSQRVIAEQRMEGLVKLRDEFIGIASHELKTPLTSISAYGELLEQQFDEAGNEDNVSLLRKLNRQSRRLRRLIDDLLDTSRIAEDKLSLKKTRFDLNQLLIERTEELQRTTDRHRLVLSLESLPAIHADRERIAQVFANLVANAIKYSPDAGDIVIASQPASDGAKVCIHDHGIGIAPEDVGKIFDRFFRSTRKGMDMIPGMGLGLYISSQIVQLHGGALTVKSAQGEGSRFCFTIPKGVSQVT